MGREFGRNEETGTKNTVQVKLDGVLIQRGFRNRGEAIEYLKRNEDLTKQDIERRVRFVFN